MSRSLVPRGSRRRLAVPQVSGRGVPRDRGRRLPGHDPTRAGPAPRSSDPCPTRTGRRRRTSGRRRTWPGRRRRLPGRRLVRFERLWSSAQLHPSEGRPGSGASPVRATVLSVGLRCASVASGRRCAPGCARTSPCAGCTLAPGPAVAVRRDAGRADEPQPAARGPSGRLTLDCSRDEPECTSPRG